MDKIHQFCEHQLHIDDPVNKIKIDRAHRIGQFAQGKKRPIVVKFNFYGDKLEIKNKIHELLPTSNYRVSDQFPKEIQERRRKLVPYLIQARKDGKQASLSYDTLYIDRVKYTYDHPPPGPVPEMPNHGPRNNLRRETGSHGTTQPRNN